MSYVKLQNENIEEILFAREEKYQEINKMLEKYSTVFVLSINYPGPNKCNENSKYVFEEAKKKINSVFHYACINEKETMAGYYAIYGLQESSYMTKEEAIQIEDSWEFGRLIDLDVYDKEKGLLSRKVFLKPNRKCFLCNEDAKICGRNRTHSVLELEEYFNHFVKEHREEKRI